MRVNNQTNLKEHQYHIQIRQQKTPVDKYK